MMSAGPRYLITGCGGFVGKHLLTRLTGQGHTVTAWTRRDVDLCDVSAVERGLRELKPDVIFHLAADGVGGSRAHDPACIGTNAMMAAHLVRSAPPGSTLVSAGSMSEYGREGVLNEAVDCRPATAYGIGKLAATHVLFAYGPTRSVHVRTARLFGVYGPGESENRLFPSLLRGLVSGQTVALSDGLQKRDFIHVGDACEGLIRLSRLTSPTPLLTNLGTGIAVGIGDVCRSIAKSLRVDGSLLKFGARPRSPGDADLLVADVTRLRELLGWVPPQRLNTSTVALELLSDSA